MTAHQRNLSSSSTSPIVNNVHLPDPDWTRTNTLALTSMPAPFFNPIILDALRSHFEGFGEIHTWAPLKAFSRVLVVYYDEEAAELAKESCDSLFVDATDFSPSALLRVYRADPTPLDQLDGNNLLRPPQLEKNFLISPPGSPPVGWEPIREDPPNHAPLADDLMVALRRLQIEQSTGGVEVLIHPDAEEGPGIGVYVEDCDGPSEPPQEEPEPSQTDWIYGQSRPQRIPTSRPPMRPQPASMPPLRVGA